MLFVILFVGAFLISPLLMLWFGFRAYDLKNRPASERAIPLESGQRGISHWKRSCISAAIGGVIGGTVLSSIFWISNTAGGFQDDLQALGFGAVFFLLVIPVSVFLGASVGCFLGLTKTRAGERHASWPHFLVWPLVWSCIISQAVLWWVGWR